MSLEQFFIALKARWKIVVASMLLLAALVLAVTLTLPKQYVASSTIVVDIKSSDPVLGMALTQPTTAANYLATQVGVIGSERVTRRVISTLKLNEDPDLRSAWMRATGGNQEPFENWLNAYIGRHVQARALREGSLIVITAEWSNPVMAARLANTVAQAYIDTNLELKVEPAKQYAEWFADRTKVLRDNLEQSQLRLSQYQRNQGVIASTERLDVETSRLGELSSKLIEAQAVRAESSSRQRQISQGIDSHPDVVQNAMISSLKADLAHLIANREDAGTRYGANHPDIVRLDKEIGALRARIGEESQRVANAVSTSNRINGEKEGQIRAELDAQKSRVLALTKQRDEIAFLQADVANAQKAYDMVTQRLQQTSLESQTQTANVMIITPATTPAQPSSPRPVLNTLIGLVLGSLLGTAIVLVLERLNRRVRTEDDLRDALSLPMLGRVTTA
jgi:chain length determinant protein EpsF